MLWILPTFNHDLYMFLESFICIRSLFRAFTDFGTHLREIVILEHFGTFLKSYAKITKANRLLEITINRQITSPLIDREPRMSIDSEPSARTLLK